MEIGRFLGDQLLCVRWGNMRKILELHLSGIITLIISIVIPLILLAFKQWENNIKVAITKEINGTARRIDTEIYRIKEEQLLLKENLKQLEKSDRLNLESIEDKLNRIEADIIKLEDIKIELAGTREMLLIQNKALNQQFTDFKEFISTFIRGN